MRANRFESFQPASNEPKKGRHFGEKFWLYVVTEAGTDGPEPHRIRDPAAHFREGEDIFATGFIVHGQAWRSRVPDLPDAEG